MTFKTLLVHVEAEPVRDSRLDVAIDLANHFNAKLIGVGAEFPFNNYASFGIDYGAAYVAADLLAAEAERVKNDIKLAEEKFRSVAGAVREGSEWRTAIQFPLAAIAAEARAADLVITSRSNREGASDHNVAWPGALILQAGRPVLVAPTDATQVNVRSVVVAWKDTREARRAASDALPFLQMAERVELVDICESRLEASAAATRLASVANHLLRHGVKTTVNVDVAEKGSTAAQQLLDIADRQNADIIVAGGYGHSRLQEWVFGGFTQALLAQSRRAVMFSH